VLGRGKEGEFKRPGTEIDQKKEAFQGLSKNVRRKLHLKGDLAESGCATITGAGRVERLKSPQDNSRKNEKNKFLFWKRKNWKKETRRRTRTEKDGAPMKR